MRCPKTKINRACRPGAAAAEMAVLLPVLVVLGLIICDYARVYHYSLTIMNCARNGAFCGCNKLTTYATIEEAALADAAKLTPAPTVTIRYSNAAAGPYDLTSPVFSGSKGYIQVTVAWKFKTAVNYPGIPNEIDLSRSVRMRIVGDLAK